MKGLLPKEQRSSFRHNARERFFVGARFAGEGVLTAGLIFQVYISNSAVTATYGFALTASHLEKRNAARP